MANMNALVEEQNRIWAEMQEARDKATESGEPMDAQAREAWDKAEVRLTQISEDLDRFQRMAALDNVDRTKIITTGQPEVDQTRDTTPDREARYADAFGRYLRGGLDALDADQTRLLRSGYVKNEDRAQATTPDAAGGFLVPDQFLNTLQERLELFGGLMNEASVITTGTGAELSWPTNDDTANEGALLLENTQVPEQDVVFAERSLGAYTYTSKMVKLSWQLQQDSVFNIDAWLPERLGARIGRAVAKHLVNGDGDKKPLGLMVNAVPGKTGAPGQVDTITYDDLVDLEHSVTRPYRVGAKFGMSDAMLKVIRKIKDSDGRPIWQPVPVAGTPATINGNPYFLDDGFAEPGAGAKSIAYGNFRLGYLVRRVRDVQVIRLNERYADYLQSGYFAFSRLDAMPDDPHAIRVYQHPAE